MKRFSILLMFVVLGADLATAQTFFNSNERSGMLVTPGVPGVSFYHDQQRSGQIIEMAPGITFYHFSNTDRTPGESGIAVDMNAGRESLTERMDRTYGRLPRQPICRPRWGEGMTGRGRGNGEESDIMTRTHRKED